jgi:cytochrome c
MVRGPRWLTLALSVAVPTVALADGDADAGARVFAQCAPCHSVQDATQKIGPTLKGVIGRRAGSVPDYKYSGFMVMFGEDGLIWSESELSQYLANPANKIPGTRMAFSGLERAQDVANVIAYIRQFSQQ